MKVIKHGIYKKIINCSCGCIFKYKTKDIKKQQRYIGSKLGTVRTEYYVICPECDEPHFVPKKIAI